MGGVAILSAAVIGCNPSCPERLPSPFTIELEHAGAWEPGLYSISISTWLAEVGPMHALCVVELPYASGDLVSCTDNAELDLGPTGIERMVSMVGGPASHQVSILRDRDLLFEEQLGDILRSPEEALEACQRAPVDLVVIEL